MKKLLIISVMMVALPFTVMAQDDLYFVPKKSTKTKVVKEARNKAEVMDTEVYYSGSNRDVDEYNRMKSQYQIIENDSTSDIIDFTAVKGVYPDSLAMASDSLNTEDYALTKKMMRFDDYDLTENAAFWAGYHLGRDTWNWGLSWHSPWYYHTFGLYGGWYDPWYYNYSIYDPWYYRYTGFYDPWYNWYYGWHYPWRYAWGYYPYGYYYDYYPYYVSYGGGSRYHNTYNGNTGTIDRNGSTHGYFAGNRSAGRSTTTFTSSSSRTSSLRDRTVGNHTSRLNRNGSTVTNNRTSGSGNFSGSRSTNTYNNNSSNTSRSTTYSNGSSTYSGSSSTYSGGGGGGSFSGGGGGGRSGGGGGSLGGRR